MPQAERRCPHCQAIVPDSPRYCPRCGAAFERRRETLTLAKVLAALATAGAALILGWLGTCLAFTGLGTAGQGPAGIGLSLFCWVLAGLAFAALARVVR